MKTFVIYIMGQLLFDGTQATLGGILKGFFILLILRFKQEKFSQLGSFIQLLHYWSAAFTIFIFERYWFRTSSLGDMNCNLDFKSCSNFNLRLCFMESQYQTSNYGNKASDQLRLNALVLRKYIKF